MKNPPKMWERNKPQNFDCKKRSCAKKPRNKSTLLHVFPIFFYFATPLISRKKTPCLSLVSSTPRLDSCCSAGCDNGSEIDSSLLVPLPNSNNFNPLSIRVVAKKLARNKSLKSPGLKKSPKNAKFSIVSVSLYNYDSRYFFISWRLWLKSFPSNLTRKIEPNLYILKLMNVFNKFLKLISIISPAKYSDILGKCHDE